MLVEVLVAVGVAALLGGDVYNAMEFADDNKPKTTFAKHIKFEELKAKNRNRKILNVEEDYLVKINRYKVGKYKVDIKGYDYVIAEPVGMDKDRLLFNVRFVCNKTFKKCRKP